MLPTTHSDRDVLVNRVPDRGLDIVGIGRSSDQRGFERAGGLVPSDNVVIQGAGAVGLYALAYALGCGARQVIVLGAPAHRLAIAGSWGAHEVIDIETTDAAGRVVRVRESPKDVAPTSWSSARGTASPSRRAFH